MNCQTRVHTNSLSKSEIDLTYHASVFVSCLIEKNCHHCDGQSKLENSIHQETGSFLAKCCTKLSSTYLMKITGDGLLCCVECNRNCSSPNSTSEYRMFVHVKSSHKPKGVEYRISNKPKPPTISLLQTSFSMFCQQRTKEEKSESEVEDTVSNDMAAEFDSSAENSSWRTDSPADSGAPPVINAVLCKGFNPPLPEPKVFHFPHGMVAANRTTKQIF
jgi:hypothetical protein